MHGRNNMISQQQLTYSAQLTKEKQDFNEKLQRLRNKLKGTGRLKDAKATVPPKPYQDRPQQTFLKSVEQTNESSPIQS